MIWTLQILLATLIGLSTVQAQEANLPRTTSQINNSSNNLDKTDDTGIGFKWGNLTGIEFKHWYDQENALVLGLAFDEGNTAIGVDYLWHFRGTIAAITGLKNTSAFVPYVGAGLIAAIGDNNDFFDRDTENFGLALRAPIGIEFLPTRLTVSIFAEAAPSFGVTPTTFTFMSGNIGARYYF